MVHFFPLERGLGMTRLAYLLEFIPWTGRKHVFISKIKGTYYCFNREMARKVMKTMDS